MEGVQKGGISRMENIGVWPLLEARSYIWLKSTKSGPVGFEKIDFSHFSPCSMQWMFQTPGVSIVHVQKNRVIQYSLVFAWSALKVGSFG